MGLLKVGLVLTSLMLPLTGCGQSGDYNGFDVSDSLVPSEEIHHGGPARDGIPAIDEPQFVAAEQVPWLGDDDPVLGITEGGEARAYPVAILNWHEIVNDEIGGRSVTVTYCPLCGSGMAFASEVRGRNTRFGVSGLLYNSDMLLYDRDTQSLWSQLMEQAISGPLKGVKLLSLPLQHTRWADWRSRYPDTRVLSRDTGHRRDYEQDPYAGYVDDYGLYFRVKHRDPRYHPKERVLGLVLDGKAKAYPYTELDQTGGEVQDNLAGQEVQVRFDRTHQSARALDASGKPLPAVSAFWFAWYAFHPDTEVFQAIPGP